MSWAVSTVGFAVGGLVANGKVSAYNDDIETAAAAYNQPGLTAPEYDSHWEAHQEAAKQAESSATARNWMYSLSGVFAIGFAISVWF